MNFWRWVATGALVLCGLLVGERYVRDFLLREVQPRLVVPRGDLAPDERRTTTLFTVVAPAVVSIQAMTRANPFARDGGGGGSGSGFIWDRAGHVVTNHHVIENTSRIVVVLDDGRSLPARLVGSAPWTDLAVLRIEYPPRDLQPIAVGSSSDLLVGQTVFAIGNPFGLSGTLTQGIISAVGRRLPTDSGREISDVIQTDAAINPGNSGGPLIDSVGRLVGVNTAIVSPAGSSAGVGFAIPVDTVNRIVPSLIRDGRAPLAGIGITTLPEEAAARAGVRGVIIGSVMPGRAAAQAGLTGISPDGRIGDVIIAASDKPVIKLADLAIEFDRIGVGKAVSLTIIRDGVRRDQSVIVQDISR